MSLSSLLVRLMISLQGRSEFLAQLCPRAMQQHADYHLRCAEYSGDLEIAVPFKILEHDELRGLRTERRNSSPDLILKLPIDVLSFRTWLGAFGRGRRDFFERHRARAGPASQQIERGIDCGAVKITSRAGGEVDFLITPHESEKNSLEHILGIRGAPGHAISRAKDLVVMFSKEHI